MVKRLFGGIALCVVLHSVVWANPPTTAVIGTPPQPSWSQLSVDQRAVLSPLGNEWDKMEFVRRKKWLLIAERFQTMKPEEQRRVQERMREWVLMTPEQRAKVRDSYKEFSQLPEERKQIVKQKWEAYSNMTGDEKARLKSDKETKQAAAMAAPATAAPPTGPTGTPTGTPSPAGMTATPATEPAKP